MISRATDDDVRQALSACNGIKAHASKLLAERGVPLSRTGIFDRVKKWGNPQITGDSGSVPGLDFQERVGEIINNHKSPEKLTWEDLEDAFKQAAVREKTSIRQSVAKCEIKTNVPIALSFMSDVHLGSSHTDYDAFFGDLKTIAENPQIYLMKGGDWCDKFIPSFRDANASAWQLQPPEIQLRIVEELMKRLRGTLVAVIGGNHDRMDSKKTGISTEYFIHRNLKVPYLPEGGLVEITIGEVKYKILWKHDYRFNSAINLFNAHHRLLEQLAPDVDVVVTEHQHNPGMESIEKFDFDQKRTVISVRTGSYKLDDPYSMGYFKAGRPGPQTIIFWPDRRKILGIHGADSLNDAVASLRGHR